MPPYTSIYRTARIYQLTRHLYRILIPSSQIASAASITAKLTSQLEKCPSDTYVVISQPGVGAADYGSRFSSPHLRKRIAGEDEKVRSSFTVADVSGEIDPSELVRVIEKKCGAGLMSVDASSKSSSWARDGRFGQQKR